MPGQAYAPIDQFNDSSTPAKTPKIYTTQDFVLGGATGDSNLPIEQLFDDTFYLYNRLGRFEDVRTIANDYGYDPVDARKLFSFVFSGVNRTFSLPLLADVPDAHIIAITTEIASVNCLTVLAASSEQIKFGSTSKGRMYMHDGEVLVLVAADTHWKVLQATGNFDNVGDSFHARAVRKNTFLLDGNLTNNTLLNRANNARLFEFVKTFLTDGVEVVSDTVWLGTSSTDNSRKGCFSWGDGDANTGTTFRLPDERAMFDRSLDLGRGLDIGRIAEAAGAFEEMDLQSHRHSSDIPTTNPTGTQYEGNTIKNGSDRGLYTGSQQRPTTSTDGLETRPKNIGKIPLIYY